MDLLAQLIKDNLELVCFVHGVVFLFLATALLTQRSESGDLPIQTSSRLVALAVLGLGLAEWLLTWMILHGWHVGIAIARTAVIAGAALFMIEYARRLALAGLDQTHRGHEWGHPLGPWIYAGLAVTAVALLALHDWSMAEGSRWVHLGLEVPAAFLAACALGLYAMTQRDRLHAAGAMHYLVLASLSLGLYAVLTGAAGMGGAAAGVDPRLAGEVAVLPVAFARASLAALFAIVMVGLMGALQRRQQRELVAALERADRRSRGILDAAGEGIIEVDPNGIIHFANPAAAELLDYESDELEGKFFHALFLHSHPDGEPYKSADSRILAAVRRGEPLAGDDEHFWRKDGEGFPVEYTVTPMRQEERLLGAVITFSDISHRERLTRLLRDTQEIAHVGGWEYRPSSGGMSWTHETYRLYDMTPGEEVSLETVLACCRSKSRRLLEAALDEAIEHGRDFDLEIEIRTPRGRQVWLRVLGRPVQRVGSGYRLTGTCQDVTERKRSERALRESREFYELILDTIPIRIAYARADQTISYLNKAYVEWFGLSAEELLGRKVEDVVSPDAYEDMRPYIRRVLRGSTVQFKSLADQDDDPRHLEIHYLPHLGPDGSVQGFFSVVQDVTEHEALEEKLVQAQKMEAVGQLTGGVAHDFNNLLGVILGNLQLLERPLRSDEKLHKKVKTATRAAMRGADLTRRLLAFSRRQRLDPKVVDLNGLVAGLDEMLRRTLGEHIDVTTSFTGRLWPTLVDPGQLESALVNLAINARDAMPDGGKLTIETRNASIDASEAARIGDLAPGEYVVLTVGDNGCGIPDEHRDCVFQPFFTTKEVGKGSGLGLSMVYGFVEQSGGTVSLESDVGVGTRVHLYLPRSEAVKTDPREETAVHRFMPGGSERVLLVEDEEDVRETVAGLLDELGYEVLAAPDGETALAAIETRDDIDLLLTDVMMPGVLDGPALAEEARRARPGLRVLFMTGFAAGRVLSRIDSIPGADLIAKPYRNEELAVKIRLILDGEKDDGAIAESAAGTG